MASWIRRRRATVLTQLLVAGGMGFVTGHVVCGQYGKHRFFTAGFEVAFALDVQSKEHNPQLGRLLRSYDLPTVESELEPEFKAAVTSTLSDVCRCSCYELKLEHDMGILSSQEYTMGCCEYYIAIHSFQPYGQTSKIYQFSYSLSSDRLPTSCTGFNTVTPNFIIVLVLIPCLLQVF